MNWSVPRQGSVSKVLVPIGQLLGPSDNSPSIEQVEEYCQTIHYHRINPYQFHAYYSRKKWCDKYGNPIKDWKRSVEQWELYGEEYAKTMKGLEKFLAYLMIDTFNPWLVGHGAFLESFYMRGL